MAGEGARPRLDRRRFLVMATAALATAGCGRPSPGARRSAAVTSFFVSTAQGPVVTEAVGSTSADASAAQAAAAATWFDPVLAAFNDGHPGLRAVYAPAYGPAKDGIAPLNPELSCWLGDWQPARTGAEALDLAPAMLHANFDRTALWPAMLANVTASDGGIPGLPIDLELLALQWDPSLLQQAGIAQPPSNDWTSGQFLQFVGQLAAAKLGRLQTFGTDLSVPGGRGAFFGYAQGFGGEVYAGGRVSLTSDAVLGGLSAYAEVLAQTWVAMDAHPASTALGFSTVGWSPGNRTWAQQGYARFPHMPQASVVPARLARAVVPRGAPEPEAGTAFTLWLLGPEGQDALTALGYPGMRRDADGSRSWLQTNGTDTTSGDLVFSNAGSPVDVVTLDYVVTAALSAPSTVRLGALKDIEAAANRFLAGAIQATACVGQYIAALGRIGITDIPAWLASIGGAH